MAWLTSLCSSVGQNMVRIVLCLALVTNKHFIFMMDLSFSLDHCSSPDKTPTFSSDVQSKRFRRSFDEYNVDPDEPELDEMEYKELYDEEKPVMLPAEEEGQGRIDVEKDLDLAERVVELEQTVASMAATLTKLEDAFNSLQSQASI